ncbi:M48 family metallopeptidase [Dyadobacter sp. 3J3]|uniref:M48 family metallopeptidase n=1 Tax=Dyadobacter sp. 3J3 TaxID=2606600 RepID=UPI00135A3EE2|nr:SprT family zinc-dependent metalloprotease [Dyadobacter sp. 3J3]
MKDYIDFGSKKIEFHLEFNNRKSLGITVTPALEVLVKAPIETPIEKIKEKLQKKGPWILKQLSFFLSFHPKTPTRKFVSGETHLYLGRQYRLKIIHDESKTVQDYLKINRQFIEVYVSDKSKVEIMVKNWYLAKAKERFHQLAKPLFEQFVSKYNLTDANYQLVIREMPTRWGSCTPKGKIILNPELIKAPKGCIEYVIIHELCHLVHHDHTQKFIDLQTKEMPDWEKWKTKLEKLLA